MCTADQASARRASITNLPAPKGRRRAGLLLSRPAAAAGSADAGVLLEIRWQSGGLLTLAVKHGHIDIVRLLLDLGADVDERTTLDELEEPTPSWGSPLWFASLARRRDIAELLLDRGA